MLIHANLYYARSCLLRHECSLQFVIHPFCYLLSICQRFIWWFLWIKGLVGCLIISRVIVRSIPWCSCMRWIIWIGRIPVIVMCDRYTLSVAPSYYPPAGTIDTEHIWTCHSTKSTISTVTYLRAHFFSNIFAHHHHMSYCSKSSL